MTKRFASAAELAKALAPFTRIADLHSLLVNTPPAERISPDSLTKTLRPETTDAHATSVRPARSEPVPGRRRRILTGLVGALLGAVLLVVIVVATDRGEIQIDLRDDLQRAVTVKLLREVGAKDNWEIQTGKNHRRICSGRVEVKLPGNISQDFVLEGADRLVVKRLGAVTLTLTRRDTTSRRRAWCCRAKMTRPGASISMWSCRMKWPASSCRDCTN